MSVANHLRIDLDEYDSRIRTFVPHYETLLAVTATALGIVASRRPTVVDLGTGTGALAAACLDVRPDARILGIDADAGMLAAARNRLGKRDTVELRQADFLNAALPTADAMVACISLHHIREPVDKQGFYRRVFEALAPGGVLITADCFPAIEPTLAAHHRDAWIAHLEQTYPPPEAAAHLQSWSDEDTYFPLEIELTWLRDAGFTTEVIWRKEGFAVLAAFRT
jgi:tRNA (cmo5U34)-methyltransferase